MCTALGCLHKLPLWSLKTEWKIRFHSISCSRINRPTGFVHQGQPAQLLNPQRQQTWMHAHMHLPESLRLLLVVKGTDCPWRSSVPLTIMSDGCWPYTWPYMSIECFDTCMTTSILCEQPAGTAVVCSVMVVLEAVNESCNLSSATEHRLELNEYGASWIAFTTMMLHTTAVPNHTTSTESCWYKYCCASLILHSLQSHAAEQACIIMLRHKCFFLQ